MRTKRKAEWVYEVRAADFRDGRPHGVRVLDTVTATTRAAALRKCERAIRHWAAQGHLYVSADIVCAGDGE